MVRFGRAFDRDPALINRRAWEYYGHREDFQSIVKRVGSPDNRERLLAKIEADLARDEQVLLIKRQTLLIKRLSIVLWCALMVLERDGHTCTRCGWPKGVKRKVRKLHVHHLRRHSRGGDHALLNLATLCDICHGKQKGSGHNWIRPRRRKSKRWGGSS